MLRGYLVYVGGFFPWRVLAGCDWLHIPDVAEFTFSLTCANFFVLLLLFCSGNVLRPA